MAAAARKILRQIRMDFDHIPVTQDVVDALVAEMREVYLRPDGRPWVVGYSGGKDSTAVVQLVWRTVKSVPPEQRTKPVYVISSDTLVENPKVAAWLDKCHEELRRVSAEHGLPITVVKVTPDPKDSFWVCLIGKGYPSPTQDFRWCTGRLKIEPSEAYVIQHIEPTGRILQLLGSRKKESKAREASIEAHALEGKFGTTGSLTEGVSYQPIQDWDNDNVWEYLRLFPTPWHRPDDVVLIPDPLTGELVPNHNNELFWLYQDAHGGECVLDFDRRTASCGGSRFGCWTCTVVPEDISMTNMVQMVTPEYAPLLAFRDKIQRYRNDYSKRNPVGRNGRLRLNSTARTAAAQAYADGKVLHQQSQIAFEKGAKWAESDWYKPAGTDQTTAAARYVEAMLLDEADAPEIQEAFLAGARWSVDVLGAKQTEHVTPGPYLLEVRAELLENLFEIEQALPGFRTVTDSDIHWIKHWWRHDGGDTEIVDHLVVRYRGGAIDGIV